MNWHPKFSIAGTEPRYISFITSAYILIVSLSIFFLFTGTFYNVGKLLYSKGGRKKGFIGKHYN